MDFYRWLISIGKSAKTAKNYNQAIDRSISQWAIDAELTNTSLLKIDSISEFRALLERIQELDIFVKRNGSGNGMYSAALKAYVQYLEASGEHDVAEDVEKILIDDSIPDTEKKTFISARIGQGQFRDELYAYWQGCAVTGHPQKRMLIASHIQPWSVSDNKQRLDPYNGLLLAPNIDKAFDLGYITFANDGRILISDELERPSILGISLELRITLTNRHRDYLAYHRDKEFKG